jgi:hypothetical protein
MAKFLSTRTGGLTMGPAPMVNDVEINDAVYGELLEFHPDCRVAAREMIRLRAEAEATADVSDTAVEAFNAALDAHESAMSSLGDLRAAGEAERAAVVEFAAEQIAAAEKAADSTGVTLDEARKKMGEARAAYSAAALAHAEASARLNTPTA